MKLCLSLVGLLLACLPLQAAPTTNALLWQDFAWPMDDQTPAALRECVALAEARETSQALTRLDELRAQNPADPAPHHLSALLFWQSGNREEATRRFLLALRSPDAKRITRWALAAISAQARSQAECVGWIKQAGKSQPPREVARWLVLPYFAGFCDYPPYRVLLAEWGLRELCPQDVPIAVAPTQRTDPLDREKIDVLLESGGPAGGLRLNVGGESTRFGPVLNEPPPPAEGDKP